jgi:hypothetical protein
MAAKTVLDPARIAECIRAVDALFVDLFAEVHGWRQALEAARGEQIDSTVEAFAVPALNRPDSMLIGAGFIGAPTEPGLGPVNFVWWLGPTSGNPLFPETAAPSRLDVATRNYTDYLQDFTNLEWYRVPESTRQAHVTGPYVDYLCICDYILTVTMPVQAGADMAGVVGADVYVKRLERELLPALLSLGRDAALVNANGRVIVSTDLALPVGAIAAADHPQSSVATCRETGFRLLVRDFI